PECDEKGGFIEEASKLCTVSVAHTATDYDGAKAAFEKGATHATHLFNAMSGLTHREPGVVGAVFDTETVSGELICDGIHIHPAVVRHVFNVMPERVCVISDAMRMSGMGDGEGMLGVNLVTVKDGKATLEDGTIAGSVTNLHDELKNLVSWGIPLEKAVRAMTLNPAKQIGMDDEIGSLAVGKRADLVVLDENLEIAAVYH
ncbi:MAG: amidohydrolase family protein, partial [Clostridia bacterium]|nr:amidohydrolase family protein [Clostridia bacterium]